MPWFKVDDGFHGHPKVMDLPLAAVGLWTVAGSWCAKYLTDGLVPDRTLPRLGGTLADAEALEGAGLWEKVDDGWQFKDWLDYQPSKLDIEAERAAAQERMRKVRAAKKGVRANISRTDDERSGEQPANVREVFGRSSADVRLTPSHPIPAQPDPHPSDEKTPRNRGSRLPEGWKPTADDVTKAREFAPLVDVRAEHDRFVDYWIAQPGQKAVKTDWSATWRNWMRRRQEDIEPRPTPQKQTKSDRARSVIELGERLQAGVTAEQRALGT